MNRLENKINPPRCEETSQVEKEAEVVAKIFTQDIIYQAERRAKGCGCRNCHFDAQKVKEDWG